MTLAFDSKVAMVTGAAGGIGQASALAFARRGATVALCDIGDMSETQRQIEELGGRALPLKVDVASSQSVRDAIEAIVGEFGKLDFAHNNAGTASFAPLAQLAEEDWDRVLGVNLTGVFLCMKYQIPHLLETSGAIVNTASVWGFSANMANSAYVASKHGLVGLTRAAALDYGQRGIRINAVAPGPITTPMTAHAPAEALAPIVARTTQGRMGLSEEVAEAVVWLCAPEASYVNGVILPVDGGYMAT